MTSSISTDRLTCSGCGYLLRGLSAKSRCPECGQRVRRTLAAARLKRWKQIRTLPPEIVEGVIGLVLGVFVLALMLSLISGRTPLNAAPYILTGIGVGFCVTLLYSSVRRTRRNLRAAVLACGIPSILATTLWLLIVLGIISSREW